MNWNWNNDRWLGKTGYNWKKLLRKILIFEKHRVEINKKQKKNIGLESFKLNDFISVFTINTRGQTTRKNCWKISHRGQCASNKTLYSKKVLSFLLWNWKHFTAIMKQLSVNFISMQPHFHFPATCRLLPSLTVLAMSNELLEIRTSYPLKLRFLGIMPTRWHCVFDKVLSRLKKTDKQISPRFDAWKVLPLSSL